MNERMRYPHSGEVHDRTAWCTHFHCIPVDVTEQPPQSSTSYEDLAAAAAAPVDGFVDYDDD